MIQKTYNLQYYIGTKLIETIRYNIPYGIAKGMTVSLAKEQQYKLGKFVIKPN
jgi:hypothetical protein